MDVEVGFFLPYIVQQWCKHVIGLSLFFYRVDELLDELRIDTTSDGLEYVVFFKGLKSMEINIFLCDLECLTNFEAPMFDKWLVFMLVHRLAKTLCQTNVGTFCQMHKLLGYSRLNFKMEEGQKGGGQSTLSMTHF